MKRILLVFTILLMVFFCLACGKESEATSNDTKDLEEKKTLNAATYWLSDDVEPTTSWNGWVVARFGVGENLVQLDEQMNFKASIAKSWKQIDDKTVEFTINEGVKFNNGNIVDAQACKTSIERALKLTNREDVKFPIELIEADGLKLRIKTAEVVPTLINLLADPVFIILDTSAEETENFAEKPVTTGPFKIISFESTKGLTLVKNEHYWKSDVAVDEINVKLIKDTSARAMALQSGEIQFASAINRKDLELFENNQDYIVQRGPNLRVAFLAFNMGQPYMKELKFRQALAYGIDKKTYAEELYDATMAKGPFNESLSFGYKGEDVYVYNPEKANALLDSLGIVDSNGDGLREYDGKNIVLQFATLSHFGRDAANTGVALQSQYKELGLGLEVTQYENLSEIKSSQDIDIIWDRWTSAPTADPQYLFETAFMTGASANRSNYSNKEFDEICKKLKTTIDKSQRDKLGVEGSKILMDDAGVIFLFYLEGSVVTTSDVEGISRFVSDVYHIDERVRFNK